MHLLSVLPGGAHGTGQQVCELIAGVFGEFCYQFIPPCGGSDSEEVVSDGLKACGQFCLGQPGVLCGRVPAPVDAVVRALGTSTVGEGVCLVVVSDAFDLKDRS